MITTKDQEQLFTLIANYLESDVSCIAIGGTAMMFLGYKNTTKDIDLIFESEEKRDIFIRAIEELGYTKHSTKGIYSDVQTKRKGVPLMYSKGEERFDLFVKHVFGLTLPFDLHSLKMRADFLEKSEFIVHILPEEYLILCKAITNREKDFDDITTIVKLNKDINWNLIIEYAISQKKNNSWILIDLEEKLRALQKIIFLKEALFEKIYAAQG